MKKNYFINMVKATATGSYCKRLQVGAVIVNPKDKRIISTGYNGQPAGACNDCEKDGVTMNTVIHAELNAILYAKMDLTGFDIYITHSPCEHCAACIMNSGIRRVIYIDDYRSSDGVDFLKAHGIDVIKYNDNEN